MSEAPYCQQDSFFIDNKTVTTPIASSKQTLKLNNDTLTMP